MRSFNSNAAFRIMLTTFIGNVMLLLASHSEYSHSFQPVVVTAGIDSCMGQCRLNSRPVSFRIDFSTTAVGMSGSGSDIENISIPFDGSEDRFDRWKFLQDVLECGYPSSDLVNVVLYQVLEGVLKYPRPSGGRDTQGSDDTIEMTADVKEIIKEILADYSTEGRVNAVMSMSNNDEDIEKGGKLALATLEKLESVLPDPVENEDDYKSLWDTVIELYGREAVKYNESQKPVALDWKIANTVARVLLHFDFLTHGVIDAPL